MNKTKQIMKRLIYETVKAMDEQKDELMEQGRKAKVLL
jgi:hypothetical protein